MAVKNSRATAAKKRQRVQINLGCGHDLLEGFVNIDAFMDSDAPNFKKADIRSIPFDRDSVDYALLNNVLEHLPQADVPMVLYELRRVLKSGGRAVIIVPDFSTICTQWLSIQNHNFNAVVYQYLSEVIYGNQRHEGEYHRTAMSPQYLDYVLHMTGFHKYRMTMYTAGSRIEGIPGITMPIGTELRNAFILADITK